MKKNLIKLGKIIPRFYNNFQVIFLNITNYLIKHKIIKIDQFNE